MLSCNYVTRHVSILRKVQALSTSTVLIVCLLVPLRLDFPEGTPSAALPVTVCKHGNPVGMAGSIGFTAEVQEPLTFSDSPRSKSGLLVFLPTSMQAHATLVPLRMSAPWQFQGVRRDA